MLRRLIVRGSSFYRTMATGERTGEFGGSGAMKKAGINKDPKEVSGEEWKNVLSKEEYHVTREAGTEAPFTGKYDKMMKPGLYNCICCGALLFDSESKFNSGCGWPAFSKEKMEGETSNVVRIADNAHGMQRTEVRCKQCDAHLGHVFDDGPEPTGERFCINSVCLDFAPKSK